MLRNFPMKMSVECSSKRYGRVDWHAHFNVIIGGYITIYGKETSKTSMRSLITHVSFLAIVICNNNLVFLLNISR